MKSATVLLKAVSTILAASVFVAGCNTAPPAKQQTAAIRGSDCVFFHTLYDWQPLDDHNMVIWAPSHDAYQLYFITPLIGLNFSINLAFVDKDRDGRLCGFSRDEVVYPDHAFPQRATIAAMKKLSDEDIAKLEAQYKVKLARYTKKEKPKEPERETAK
jgi:hypothetical protein